MSRSPMELERDVVFPCVCTDTGISVVDRVSKHID